MTCIVKQTVLWTTLHSVLIQMLSRVPQFNHQRFKQILLRVYRKQSNQSSSQVKDKVSLHSTLLKPTIWHYVLYIFCCCCRWNKIQPWSSSSLRHKFTLSTKHKIVITKWICNRLGKNYLLVISNSSISSFIFPVTVMFSKLSTFCWWLWAFLAVNSWSFLSISNLLNSSLHFQLLTSFCLKFTWCIQIS